jgi:hypothetical protein
VARTIPIWSSSLIGFAVLLHLRSVRRERLRASAVSIPRNEPERAFGPGSAEATVAV